MVLPEVPRDDVGVELLHVGDRGGEGGEGGGGEQHRARGPGLHWTPGTYTVATWGVSNNDGSWQV